MSAAIGLDIGRSAVKVAASNAKGELKLMLIPSAVCQAFYISDEAEAERAARETVRVGMTDYFIGETAVIQGGASITTGVSEDWITTPEHAALMIGAWRKAKEYVESDNPRVVLGLPTHLYARQKNLLRDTAVSILGLTDVRVIPQPMGPYFEAMLDQNGAPKAAVSEESWGVVEIGYFTTDFTVIKNGRWVEKASGICSGARVAAEQLQRMLGGKGFTLDLMECDEALRKRYIRNFNSRLDVSSEVDEVISGLVGEIVSTAKRLMDAHARKLDGIIVAGGGAPLAYKKILERWPNAICPESPRFSVAEGMRRYAAMLNLKEALKE